MNANLNKLSHLKFIKSNSESELLVDLQKINMPVEIISIYPMGSRHIAWFFTEQKIVTKKTRRNKNATS